MVTGAETPQSPGEYSEFTEFTARDEEDLLQQLYENTVDQACRFPTGCGAGTLGDQPLDLLIVSVLRDPRTTAHRELFGSHIFLSELPRSLVLSAVFPWICCRGYCW